MVRNWLLSIIKLRIVWVDEVILIYFMGENDNGMSK